MTFRRGGLPAISLTLLTIACTPAPPPAARVPPLRLSTSIAARIAASSAPGTLQTSGVPMPASSVKALEMLQDNTLDVGIAMADVTYLAYNGQLEDAPRPFDALRGMALLNLNTLHVLATRDHIQSIRDLRGMRVALGPLGSATARIAMLLLNAAGLDEQSVKTVRLPYAETVKRMEAGELDAAFMTQPTSPPDESVAAATRHGARLLNVDGPAIDRLRTQYPFLKSALIPGGTYPGQPAPISTIGVDLVLICRAALDEDTVYRLMQAYFAVPAGTMSPTDLERAPATPIPLHAGAARYYRQRELSR